MTAQSTTETKSERATETILEVSDLTKVYPDGTLAVDGIDFSVDAGDFCVVIGPSGCGKSTTLHSIVGNVDVTEGVISLSGDDITDLPTYRRDISLVFQDFQLFPHLTVRENIQYGLERAGVPDEEIEDRVEDVASTLKIRNLLDRDPGELSAGQQQQVALARSLVLEPKLLLLDEPLGDLDYKLQKRMERELLRIHHEFETTFVYVTHDQTQAMRLADQIVVMNDGRIEQSGTAEEVYDAPETAFVSAFVGDSNTLTGELTAVSDDRATVETEFGSVRASTRNLTSRPSDLVGDEIVLSVRPQYVSLDGDGENALTCEVDDVFYHPASGTEVILVAERGPERQTFKAKVRGRAVEPTGEVTVTWSADDTVLLEEISAVPGVDLETDILGE